MSRLEFNLEAIQATKVEDFIERVNLRLSEGWTLHGNTFIDNENYYNQAFVREFSAWREES